VELFTGLFQAFKDNATAALLVVTLIAFGWVVRDMRRREDEHLKSLEALHAAHEEKAKKASDEHLATALQVAPLASKLIDCVGTLERLSAARAGGT
jgi:DNA-binding GntR family transcriptional regulator